MNALDINTLNLRQDKFIIKAFEGKQIDFVEREGKIWLTSSAIAIGLEIDRTNINQIYHNNIELLTPYTCVMKIISQGQSRDIRVFDKIGFIGICMRSNSPKALPFQKWVLQIVDEISQKGYYIETRKDMDRMDWILKQIDVMKEMAIEQKEQRKKLELVENKVSIVNQELQNFEEKYEDERIITPQTKKRIKDFVHDCHEKTGKHWAHFWSKIWNEFSITTTTNISEKLGQEILNWLKNKIETFLE